MSGENTKRREDVERLEWQGELDSHLTDIDSRLTRTRRRAVVRPNPDSVQSGDSPAVAATTAEPQLKPGKVLMIRYRMPRLPWPFRWLQRRRREHPLTTAKVRV